MAASTFVPDLPHEQVQAAHTAAAEKAAVLAKEPGEPPTVQKGLLPQNEPDDKLLKAPTSGGIH